MNSSSSARLRPFRPVPFGRYTLLSQLATGGMGEIFLARLEGAQGFEKLCVIKKILPQLAADPEFVERFVGEARTLVKLSHGSIAQVLDMGLHEGDAYMALEYVDGKDLRKVAARARDRQRPLPLPFVLFVMGRVLDALAYAHRKKGDDEAGLNLVHRDISPQNILVSYEGEVKVIDFGLAKSRLSAAKTNPSIILGKFLYMSPEQARHQPVDRRSDLYAVGLCLYELLAGRNPFDVLPSGELMTAVAQPNIPPLEQAVPSVPPAVAELVMKALEVEPARRFQTAEEFRGRLVATLLELDAGAGPESITRTMHELFAGEYQAERKLLAGLKEVGRNAEEAGGGGPEGPRTVHPEGPVEALSFRPTPRTRESGPEREEGDTWPSAVPRAETRPGVAVSAIEESARARLRPDGRGGDSDSETLELRSPFTPREPSGGEPEPSPTLELPSRVEPPEDTGLAESAPALLPPAAPRAAAAEASSVPWAVEPAATEPAPTVPPSLAADELPWPVAEGSPSPVEEEPSPVEDISWDEPEPPVARDAAEPPGEEELEALPLEAHAPDVYTRDTQPRVVLDESLARELKEPLSRPPRARSASPGLSTPSTPAPSSPRGAAVEVPLLSEEETTPAPAAGEITLRTAIPKRPVRPWVWGSVALGMLLLGGGVGALVFHLQEPPVKVVPPPRPLRPPGPAAQAPPAKGPAAGAAVASAPAAEPATAPAPPPEVEAPAVAVGSAPSAEAPAVAVGSAPSAEADLLAPLAVESASAAPPTGKPPPRKRSSSRKAKTLLQKEWGYTRYLFNRLRKRYDCESLDLVCDRYDDLQSQVAETGAEENPGLLKDVKQLRRELKKRSRR